MREFNYFLFENFDLQEEAENPDNPRKFLGREADAVLSFIAGQPGIGCSYDACRTSFGAIVDKLIGGGVLRRDGANLVFYCPIFLKEDALVLHNEIAVQATAIVELLEGRMAEIREHCAKIKNGCSIEENLYHILCGMVFDGHFFDYLSGKGAVAVSKQHDSGLDYLTVIYEKCAELQTLSDRLLCSYNRLVNAKCALQSFGDAQGNRFDFYRFFRMMEQGSVPLRYKASEALLNNEFGGTNKEALLSEVLSLVEGGKCAPGAMRLLETFGYVMDGEISVPVFLPENRKHILAIEGIVEDCIGDAMVCALLELSGKTNIKAIRHGVDPLEVANELYHIVFGSMNEELVIRKIVAEPKDTPDEGRYLKCIEIYGE